MFDDLDAFFYENAVAAYTEHVGTKNSGVFGQSKDLRTAVNAAAALYHFREHIPESHRQSRAEVASACSDYDLLGDVVNAAKHRDLTDSRKRTPLIRSAKDIQHFLVITEYRDAQGDYRLLEKEVQTS